MADIVNLRMVRKQKAHTEKEREAERNRALHGRSKAEREQQRRTSEKAGKFIDGHRLSPETGEE